MSSGVRCRGTSLRQRSRNRRRNSEFLAMEASDERVGTVQTRILGMQAES